MARASRRFGRGAGAIALALAYALVVQLLLSGVFAGRVVADPLAAAAHATCLDATSMPTDPDDAGRSHAPHCPLCTLRLDALLPPLAEAGEELARSALPAGWAPEIGAPRPSSRHRGAHHPRGPPGKAFLV